MVRALSEDFAPSLGSLMSCLDGLVVVSSWNKITLDVLNRVRDIGTWVQGLQGQWTGLTWPVLGPSLISETSGLPLALGSVRGPV